MRSSLMSIFVPPVVFLMGVGAASCGSSPGESTQAYSLFDLTPGPKILSFQGSDAPGDSAQLEPCVFVGAPTVSKSVDTRIDLEPQGSDWVGRSISPSDGNLVLTLRSAGPAFGRHTVTGTVSGAATSVIGTPVSGPSKVQIVFDSTSLGTIDGGGSQIGLFVEGNIVARSTFTDTTGASSKCTWVVWSLQPLVE